MKIINHIYCLALTLSFSVFYGQSSSSETIAGKVATKGTNESSSLNNDFPASSINEEEIVVTPEAKIYQEPFEGIVSVNLNTYPGAQISVYDAKGNFVKNQQSANKEQAIFDLRDQPKGIYYLEIKVKGQKTVKAIYLQQKF